MTESGSSKFFSKINLSTQKFNKTPFFVISDPQLISTVHLFPDELYFFRSNGIFPMTLSPNVSESQILRFCSRQLARKHLISQIDFYFEMKQKNADIIVLVIPSLSSSFQKLLTFVSFAEAHQSPSKFFICSRDQDLCQQYLDQIGKSKVVAQKGAFVLASRTRKYALDDHLFALRTDSKNRILPVDWLKTKDLEQFSRHLTENKLIPLNFSDDVRPPAKQVVKPVGSKLLKSLLKLKFKGFMVVLFFDSRECRLSCRSRFSNDLLCNAQDHVKEESGKCAQLQEEFAKRAEKVQAMSELDDVNLLWSTFDLGKNSFGYLSLKSTLFVRFFNRSNFKQFVDLPIFDSLEISESAVKFKLLELQRMEDSDL